MAGDWIKFEHATPDKPEVVAIADQLGIDQDAVVGKLLRLWIWADQQSENGNALSVTKTFIDRITFCEGFAAALNDAGWLDGSDGNLQIPNFDRHNGKSAKQRANTAKRIRKSRKCNADTVTESATEALPEKRREEKRREESNGIAAQSSSSTSDEVHRIYQAYPRKVGKGDALKAIGKAIRKADAATLLEAVTEFAAAMSDQETQFIPHPATWFNQERWLDDRSNWTAHRETKSATSSTSGIDAACDRLEAMERGNILDAECVRHEPARIAEGNDDDRL